MPGDVLEFPDPRRPDDDCVMCCDINERKPKMPIDEKHAAYEKARRKQ